MTIRKITGSDIAASAEIVRRSFKTVAEELHLTPDNAPTNGAFLKDKKLMDDCLMGIRMFGLFEGAAQAGFMAIEQHDSTAYYLEKLAVLPQYRHRGFGRSLVEYAARYVKDEGGGNISIGIIYENERLRTWYKELGFLETGTKTYAHLPFTVCFMRLDVAEAE